MTTALIITVRCTDGLVHEETQTLVCGMRASGGYRRVHIYARRRPLTCLECIVDSDRFRRER